MTPEAFDPRQLTRGIRTRFSQGPRTGNQLKAARSRSRELPPSATGSGGAGAAAAPGYEVGAAGGIVVAIVGAMIML